MSKKDEFNKIIINSLNSDLDNFDNSKFKINLNRIAFIFIVIFIIIILYSTRIIYLSSKTFENQKYNLNQINRADITDRNGNYISKSVFTNVECGKGQKKTANKITVYLSGKGLSEIEKNFLENFFILEKVTPKDFKKLNFRIN